MGKDARIRTFFSGNDTNLIKTLAIVLAAGAVLPAVTVLICGCGYTPAVKTDGAPRVVETAEPAEVFSFEDAGRFPYRLSAGERG